MSLHPFFPLFKRGWNVYVVIFKCLCRAIEFFFFIWNKKCRYWHFKSIVTTVFSMGRSVFLPKEKRKNTYINFKLHPILWYWIIDLGHRDGPYFLHNCYCDNSKSQVEKRHKSFLTNSFVDRFISGKYLAAQMCEFLSIMLSVFDQLNVL